MAGIMSGGYGMTNGDDKDYGNGFEFTRRKRWPQLLLQELVGTSVFCVKPVQTSRSGQDGRTSNVIGWKLIYVSPSVGEMLGQKASEVEGRDFFELVYAPDHPQLQNLLYSLVHPHPMLPHTSSSSTTQTSTPSSGPPLQTSMPRALGKSQTTYARMLLTDPPISSDSDEAKRRGGPVTWEIRAHATGVDVPPGGMNGMFGMSSGTVNPSGQNADGFKGKAVWIMGRRAGEGSGDGDNTQSLDAFLELKLENERLREELKELQLDMDDLDDYMDTNPIRADYSAGTPSSSSETPSDTDSDASAPAGGTGVPKAERKKPRPKGEKTGGDKKRSKKMSISAASAVAKVAELAEGMHVCVTCGRTDSPEWRKGPLGPKTLCNACGLRWAKRNSSQPTRKDRKAGDVKGNKK